MCSERHAHTIFDDYPLTNSEMDSCLKIGYPRFILGYPWDNSPGGKLGKGNTMVHHQIAHSNGFCLGGALIFRHTLILSSAVKWCPHSDYNQNNKMGSPQSGHIHTKPTNLTITGWWFQHVSTPLKNMKANWDDDIPNVWKNKKCSKPPDNH